MSASGEGLWRSSCQHLCLRYLNASNWKNLCPAPTTANNKRKKSCVKVASHFRELRKTCFPKTPTAPNVMTHCLCLFLNYKVPMWGSQFTTTRLTGMTLIMTLLRGRFELKHGIRLRE